MSGNGGFSRPHDHDAREPFVAQIDHACRDLGVSVRWLSDSWVAVLEKGTRRGHIVGYTFGLNDSAAVELAVDKTATAEILAAYRVPVVDHKIFTFGDLTSTDAAAQIAAECPLPVVVKPARESDGLDVRRAETVDHLCSVLRDLRTRHAAIAVSPLIAQPDEYRVVILDGRVLLAFRKVLQATTPEWRHNAVFGSYAKLVSDTAPILPRLSSLARRTLSVLGLRAGAVDIFDRAGDLRVLEVNDAFSLNGFSLQSEEHFDLAEKVFGAIIAAWNTTDTRPGSQRTHRDNTESEADIGASVGTKNEPSSTHMDGCQRKDRETIELASEPTARLHIPIRIEPSGAPSQLGPDPGPRP